jgi:hypothetical protein
MVEPAEPVTAHVHNFDGNGICRTGGCGSVAAAPQNNEQLCHWCNQAYAQHCQPSTRCNHAANNRISYWQPTAPAYSTPQKEYPEIPDYLIDPIVFKDANLGVAMVAKWNGEQWIFKVHAAGNWVSVRRTNPLDPTLITPINKPEATSTRTESVNPNCPTCNGPMTHRVVFNGRSEPQENFYFCRKCEASTRTEQSAPERDYKADLYERLRNPEYAAEYLKAAESDGMLDIAKQDIAAAQSQYSGCEPVVASPVQGIVERNLKLAEYIWNVRVSAIKMPRFKGEFISKVLQDLEANKANEQFISPAEKANWLRAEKLAQQFHETYERLAPQFGYETRKESAKPWSDVPDQNKQLMIAVCGEIIIEFFTTIPAQDEEKTKAMRSLCTFEGCGEVQEHGNHYYWPSIPASVKNHPFAAPVAIPAAQPAPGCQRTPGDVVALFMRMFGIHHLTRESFFQVADEYQRFVAAPPEPTQEPNPTPKRVSQKG